MYMTIVYCTLLLRHLLDFLCQSQNICRISEKVYGLNSSQAYRKKHFG